MTQEWIDEWPGEFADQNDFQEYLHTHIPVRENPHPKEDRENRNTSSNGSKDYGERFEELLEEKYGPRLNFGIPKNGIDRGYDAIIPVLTDDGIVEKQVQVKGCFHSKKSNANLNPRISTPFGTHNGNGDDYIYHLGVYTFVDDIEDMEVLGETVLGYDAFDALMQYVQDEDPVGTNIQDSSSRKNHALIEWDLAFRFAEDVHDLYEEHGFDIPGEELYEAAKNAALEYDGREQRQISRKRPANAV